MCLYKLGTVSVTVNKETFGFDPCITSYDLSVPLRSFSPDRLLVPDHNFLTLKFLMLCVMTMRSLWKPAAKLLKRNSAVIQPSKSTWLYIV